MRTPSTYVGLTLPLKLPPKMTPMSLDQLKRGGLHGVLAVAEQSLSVATQDALVHLGQHRLKFPSLGVSETASKLFGLYLKSNNPSSTTAVQDKYRRKMEEFVQVGGGGEECWGGHCQGWTIFLSRVLICSVFVWSLLLLCLL
jgi:adenylate/nucleoside-diphosphate kinase